MVIKNKNRQRNTFPAVVTAVRRKNVRMTSKPLGYFNVCCSYCCRCITCGMCVKATSFTYDVEYLSGGSEEGVKPKRVFPSKKFSTSKQHCQHEESMGVEEESMSI